MTEQKFLQDLEKKLWASANTLRSNISAALYRDVVLGLVFLKYVSDITEPMFKKIKNNEIKILSLQKTRDTLLPKLLSGELDVSEVEI